MPHLKNSMAVTRCSQFGRTQKPRNKAFPFHNFVLNLSDFQDITYKINSDKLCILSLTGIFSRTDIVTTLNL
jgi:hypothetical protein